MRRGVGAEWTSPTGASHEGDHRSAGNGQADVFECGALVHRAPEIYIGNLPQLEGRAFRRRSIRRDRLSARFFRRPARPRAFRRHAGSHGCGAFAGRAFDAEVSGQTQGRGCTMHERPPRSSAQSESKKASGSPSKTSLPESRATSASRARLRTYRASHGRPRCPVRQLVHQEENGFPRGGIEHGGGLVEGEAAAVHGQGAGDRQPLLLARREKWGGLLRSAVSSTASSASVTRASISARPRPRFSGPKATSSSTTVATI